MSDAKKNIDPEIKEKVCLAASNYLLALNDSDFANEHGGLDRVLGKLRHFTKKWECADPKPTAAMLIAKIKFSDKYRESSRSYEQLWNYLSKEEKIICHKFAEEVTLAQ